MKKFLIVWFAFSFGYIAHGMIDQLIGSAEAQEVKMNHFALRLDEEFQKAVKIIVHNETAEIETKLSNLQNEVTFINNNLADIEKNITYMDGKINTLESKVTYIQN